MSFVVAAPELVSTAGGLGGAGGGAINPGDGGSLGPGLLAIRARSAPTARPARTA